MLHCSTFTNAANYTEEEFNGESFLLLDGGTLKEMGIKMSGQVLIKKLLNEVARCSIYMYTLFKASLQVDCFPFLTHVLFVASFIFHYWWHQAVKVYDGAGKHLCIVI